MVDRLGLSPGPSPGERRVGCCLVVLNFVLIEEITLFNQIILSTRFAVHVFCCAKRSTPARAGLTTGFSLKQHYSTVRSCRGQRSVSSSPVRGMWSANRVDHPARGMWTAKRVDLRIIDQKLPSPIEIDFLNEL